MFRYLLAFIVLGHGLIHLLGFVKAFHLGKVAQLTKDIGKPMGILWMIAAVLLVVGGFMLLWRRDSNWWIVGFIGAVLSQILVISSWSDAKWGTLANAVVLVMAVLAFGSWRFENGFRSDVEEGTKRVEGISQNVVQEKDLDSLPEPVQHYLRYVGVVGQPRPRSMRLVFNGQLRDKGKDWFPFRSEQYNFFDEPTRLFYMKGMMFGMTVPGYHAFQGGKASMDIRLFGMYSIIRNEGPEMNQAETVTLFNDWCIYAPGNLIDPRISWEPIDKLSAKAIFTNKGITISAILYFNESGQLINFISDDRYAMPDRVKYRFSTPVRDYRKINGLNLATYGETVWHYPDGEFCYGQFHLDTVEYR